LLRITTYNLMNKSTDLNFELHQKYGPIIGGKDLMRALGFRSMQAMRKAIQENRMGVTIFNIPSRRGQFAITKEVATFIENCVRR
jgi:hypothetical protein